MKSKRVAVLLLAISSASWMNLAEAYICNNAQFFEECPTSDPIFPKIVGDFKIRKDGALINAAAVACTPPISAMPISAYTDELVLLQALRAIYYMDLGRTNHLAWTTKSLYDWLKDGVGGFQISSTASHDHWGGQMFLSAGDTANYFVIRAKSDSTREFQRKWAGPAGISTTITLMMHERRHGDGSAFDHDTCCPAQKPGQSAACDKTYEETGNLSPYGIQYWLEKNWVSGYINVGVGCITPPAEQTAVIQFMQADANVRVAPTSSFCTNTPPQLTAANNPASCSCAPGATTGEPHITTFDGLLYDFQAAGDFLLVETGPGFIVQTRQVPMPNRPELATNQAVAMKLGDDRIAIFLHPTRLTVSGQSKSLDDGESLALGDAVEIVRSDTVYTIKRTGGETVRVNTHEISGGMDVSVWLGNSPPANVRGLLGNANGDWRDDIATRDGGVLAQPVSFEDLYGRYTESLRVRPSESLFGDDLRVASGVPKRPFYASDLPKSEYEYARAICETAGVALEPLLDACTLDVAVYGTPSAADVFVTATPPKAVMQPRSKNRRDACRVGPLSCLTVVGALLVIGLGTLLWLRRRM